MKTNSSTIKVNNKIYEFLDCPFCGKPPECAVSGLSTKNETLVYVECSNPKCYFNADAINVEAPMLIDDIHKLWNTRAYGNLANYHQINVEDAQISYNEKQVVTEFLKDASSVLANKILFQIPMTIYDLTRPPAYIVCPHCTKAISIRDEDLLNYDTQEVITRYMAMSLHYEGCVYATALQVVNKEKEKKQSES